jgi:protein TonB
MAELRPPPVKKMKKNRMPGIVFVVVLHIVMIYALASGLANSTIELLRGDLETTVVAETEADDTPPPPPPPDFKPPPPTVPPPDIVIDLTTAPQQQTNTITATVDRPAPPPPVAAAPPPPPPPAPILPPKSMANRNVVTAEDYPPISLRLQEQGRVMINVLVDTNGRCKDAQVTQSSGVNRLDEAAVNICKRKFRFEPATQEGKPVEGRAVIAVNFALR